MKIIYIESCAKCPYVTDTSELWYQATGLKTKYACSKTGIGIEQKYFIKIDGIAEIPGWCPLDNKQPERM